MIQRAAPSEAGSIKALRAVLLICMAVSPLLVNEVLVWVRTGVMQRAADLRGGVGTGLGVLTWCGAMTAIAATSAVLAWRGHAGLGLGILILLSLFSHFSLWPENHPNLGWVHLVATVGAAGALLIGFRVSERLER